jgi:phospholipid-translocating ATPase
MFFFVSFSIFNSMLLLGYSTIFTMFPVFSLIFDADVNTEKALSYPELYRTLQKGRELSTKTFLGWVWKATY